MKTIYTITKINFIGGSFNYNLNFKTYDLGEEFHSLSALEEAIKEKLNEGDESIIISEGYINVEDVEDFPGKEDRYEELEAYTSIYDQKIASFDNTFFK